MKFYNLGDKTFETDVSFKWVKKTLFVIFFIKTLKFSKFVADISIAQEIQDSINFSIFFNPEFDNCMTQLTIF